MNKLILQNPSMLYWLLLMIPLILLSFKKYKFVYKEISSLYLWGKIFNLDKAKRRHSMLRYLIYLFMILAFISLALAKPLLVSRTASPTQITIILDRSITMGSEIKGRSKLDYAGEEIAKLEMKYSWNKSHAKYSIIGIADSLEYIEKDLTLKKCIKTIKNIKIKNEKFNSNLALMAVIKKAEDNNGVIVISDFLNKKSKLINEINNAKYNAVKIIKIPTDNNNAGIVLFEGTRALSDTVALNSIVTNNTKKGVQFELSAKYQSNTETFKFTVPPGKQLIKTLNFQTKDIIMFKGLINSKDSFMSDNEALLEIPKKVLLNVAYVNDDPSKGKYFYALIKSLNSYIDIDTVLWLSTARYEKLKDAVINKYDIVIAENCSANFLLNKGPLYVVFGKFNERVKDYETINPGKIIEIDSENLTMKEIGELLVNKAIKLVPFENETVLIKAQNSPLMIAGVLRGNKYIYFPFNLEDSNFSYISAFPLLIKKIVTKYSTHNFNDIYMNSMLNYMADAYKTIDSPVEIMDKYNQNIKYSSTTDLTFLFLCVSLILIIIRVIKG